MKPGRNTVLGVLMLMSGFLLAWLPEAPLSRAHAVDVPLPAAPFMAVVSQPPASEETADMAPPSQGPESQATVLAESLSQLSGVAVSPLLVFSTIGAHRYFFPPAGESEASRPLHARPWVWIPFMVMLALCSLTSLTSLALPSTVNSVIEAVRYVQEHMIGLLAAGMLIPTLSKSMVAAGVGVGVGSAGVVETGVMQAGFLAGLNEISIQILLLTSFMAVRVVSLVVDALILISPIAAVDTMLRTFRTSVVVVGGGVSVWLSQSSLGSVILLALMLALIVTCFLIGGWCVRLNLFAASFAWDMLTLRGHRIRPEAERIRAFTSCKSLGVPVRTRGELSVSGAALEFHWRPWFVLSPRRVGLPTDSVVLVRGILLHSVAWPDGGDPIGRLTLPPRYWRHHQAVAERMGVEVTDGSILRGLRAGWQFIVGFFRRGPSAVTPQGTFVLAPAVVAAAAPWPTGSTNPAPAQRPAPKLAEPSTRAVVHHERSAPTLTIRSDMTIGSIQQEFTAAFPQLGLLLFEVHEGGLEKRGEYLKPLPRSSILSDVGRAVGGVSTFSGASTVGEVERFFAHAHGLHAEVCYMLGDSPKATKQSLDRAPLLALDRRANEQGRKPFQYRA
jgi:hypothetical protein